MSADMMKLGEFLRSKRLEKKMSLRELASYAKCSVSYVSNLERGSRGKKVSITFLHKLAQTPLNISFEEWLAIAGYSFPVLETNLTFTQQQVLRRLEETFSQVSCETSEQLESVIQSMLNLVTATKIKQQISS